MKKILFTILACLISVQAYAACPGSCELGWDNDRHTAWTAIYTNGHSDWSQPAAGNSNNYAHWRYNRIKYLATGNSAYTTFGSPAQNWSFGFFCGQKPFDLTVDHTTDTFTVGTLEHYQDAIANDQTIKFRATEGSLPTGITDEDTVYYLINVSGSNFQVSTTQGGGAVDITSNGSVVTYHPSDEIFYHPTGCQNPGDRTDYPELAREYAIFRDVWTATEKAQALDILEKLFNDVQEEYGLRGGTAQLDSDHVVAPAYGAYMHALAVQDDGDTAKYNEILTALGGLTATAADKTNYRNAIKYIVEKSEGEYLESSYYNEGSLKWVILLAHDIKNWTGTDHFSEITSRFDDMNNQWKERILMDRIDLFQWGDNQFPHFAKFTNTVAIWGALAQINDDSESWFLQDQHRSFSSTYLGSTWWGLYDFFDPYATRVSEATWEARGASSYVDETRGMTYFHTGWDDTADSAVFFTTFTPTDADHGIDVDNFALYRKGNYVVDYFRGYAVRRDKPYHNHFNPWGGALSPDHKGIIASKVDTTAMYAYGAATRGGASRAGQGNYVEEGISEQTRSYFYRNQDSTDIMVLFDRFDGKRPDTVGGWSSYEGGGVGKDAIQAVNFKHQIQFSIPYTQGASRLTSPFTTSSPLVTWDVSGETAGLTTYMDDTWTYAEVDMAYQRALGSSATYLMYNGTFDVQFDNKAIGRGNWSSGLTIARDTWCCIYRSSTDGLFYRAESDGTTAGDDTDLVGGSDTGVTWSLYDDAEVLNYWQLRVMPDTAPAEDWRTVLNVIAIPNGNVTQTELDNLDSNDDAKGVLLETATTNTAIIFNASRGAAIDPQANGAVDPNRMTKLNNKRMFRTAWELEIPTTGAVDLFIADIDPSRVWDITIDGVTTNSITPDADGFYVSSISSGAGRTCEDPALSGSCHWVILESQSTCDSGVDWRGCLTQVSCEGQNYYWYDNICNENPESNCNSVAWSGCANQTDCENAGWYWHDNNGATSNQCNESAEPTCNDTCSVCADQTACEASTYPCFWHTASCNVNDEGSSCNSSNLNLCTTENDCTTNSGYWYSEPAGSDPACYASPPSSGSDADWPIYPSADTFITDSGGTHGSDTNLAVKYAASPGTNHVILLAFDLSVIPNGSMLDEVKVTFTLKENAAYGNSYYLFELLKPFTEATADWTTTDGSTAWGSNGARGSSTDVEGTADSANPSGYFAVYTHQTGGQGTRIEYVFNATGIQHIQDNIGNFVYFAIHQPQYKNKIQEYYSKEYATVADRPLLEINGTPPAINGQEARKIIRGGGSVFGTGNF